MRFICRTLPSFVRPPLLNPSLAFPFFLTHDTCIPDAERLGQVVNGSWLVRLMARLLQILPSFELRTMHFALGDSLAALVGNKDLLIVSGFLLPQRVGKHRCNGLYF